MNVIDLLEKDHADVDELFRRFQIAERADTKDEIARTIVHDLSVHAAVEEMFVYPLVRVKLDSDTADHGIEEHTEIKELLSIVEKSDAGTAEHDDAMAKVIESVRHHVEEEEKDMLARLRVEATEDTLETVGNVVDSAKLAVPTHPHPLIPGTATAQLLAGPWATLVDKSRDLMSR